MIFRSKAPLRISFSGGGTDVPPYVDEFGGVVLSTTINKYAYGTLVDCSELQEGAAEIYSLDYDLLVKYDIQSEVRRGSELDLIKAVCRRMSDGRPVKLFLHSDAPPGTGLGSSSAMVVAVIALFEEWKREPMTPYEIAQLAYEIERIDLGIRGGKQDQYAATFGGFNLIEFRADTTIVNPLRIEPWILNELQYNLMLCYTGETRLSAGIIERQVEYCETRRKETMEALSQLKDITYQLKDALLQGKLDKFSDLLNIAGENKKRMNPETYSDRIDAMLNTAKKFGARAGKILGAGGGGYLLLYCDFDRKHVVAEQLELLGGRFIDFEFDYHGLQMWRVQKDNLAQESELARRVGGGKHALR